MLRFLFDHALGLIRPVGPQYWALAIRRLRRAEGWMPPMMLIVAMCALFFLGKGFGLLGGARAARVFNYIALGTWFVIGGVACLAVTIDGLKNLGRYAFSGLRRPRWWFELSRLVWMFLLFGGLSLPLFHFAPVPLLNAIGEHVFWVLPALYVAFLFLGTAGYVVSALTKRRPRGRAFQCVEYFYWLFGAITAVTMLTVWLPAQVGWVQPMTVVACVIAASLMGILLLKIAHRMDQRNHHRHNDDRM